MSNKKCHPVRIDVIPNSNYELGIAISRLRYDQIVEILAGFTEGTKGQEISDRLKGRDRLAEMLSIAAVQSENQGLHFAVITDYFHEQMAHEYLVNPKSEIAVDWARKMTE